MGIGGLMATENDTPCAPPAEPAPMPLPPSESTLWFELFAVLAVGPLSWLLSAILRLAHEPSEYTYALNAIDLTVDSVLRLVAVFYILHRSGEPWKTFGVVRPGFSDLAIGATLFMAHWIAWAHFASLLPPDELRHIHPRFGGGTDYIWLFSGHLANGLAEEMITRAYLITRLVQLLRSHWQAVLMSALVFASYHVYYGVGSALLWLFLLGLFYGGCYLFVRRVWPFALAHALMNVLIDTMNAAG